MSTRASIIYSQKFGLHIYQELLDDTVHIEVERNGVSVDVVLGTFDEWVAAGCPTRLALDGAYAPPVEHFSNSDIVPAGEVDSQPRQ